jgi:hypothetical protein
MPPACTAQEQDVYTLFVSLDQQNQQSSSSIFLPQQTSEHIFSHNKPAKQGDS